MAHAISDEGGGFTPGWHRWQERDMAAHGGGGAATRAAQEGRTTVPQAIDDIGKLASPRATPQHCIHRHDAPPSPFCWNPCTLIGAIDQMEERPTRRVTSHFNATAIAWRR
jgi:hypothetical protein